MRRKRLVTAGLILGAGGLLAGGFGWALKQEPDFYADEPPVGRVEAADKGYELVTRVQELKNAVRSKAEWGAAFTADDLNCFFRETMADGSGLTAFLPPGFHSPRVSVDGDVIRLGMRYGCGFWSTVVWVELRAWLAAEDVNVIALEILGIHAGGLPVGSQSILDSITEAAHDSNVDVTWYRHDGHPVGLFRFYADQLQPTTQIHTFRVKDGTVTVGGQTRLDPSLAGREAE